MHGWVPNLAGQPSSLQCHRAEVGQGDPGTGDTVLPHQDTSDFIPSISATFFMPGIGSAGLGALGRKENQESLSIDSNASLDSSRLANGSASGASDMAQPLLGDTRPLWHRAGPILTLCSGCVVDASQKYILPGRYGRRCTPDRLFRASSAAVMLEVWRPSDCNQLSRVITLQKYAACSVVFLPYQCKTQQKDARQNDRENLPPAPKSHLQIAVICVVVPACPIAGLGAEQRGKFQQELNCSCA